MMRHAIEIPMLGSLLLTHSRAGTIKGLRVNLAGYYTDYKNLQSNTRDPVTGWRKSEF